MSRNKGFTLIELLVVVAIVGILAAIALPLYGEQVRKSRRADAARAVGQLQLGLERWRAECPTYADLLSCKDFNGNGAVDGTEPKYPTAQASDFYTIAISGQDATAYTVTATPSGAQTGDRCGNLVANTTDKKKPTWSSASCN